MARQLLRPNDEVAKKRSSTSLKLPTQYVDSGEDRGLEWKCGDERKHISDNLVLRLFRLDHQRVA